MHTHDVGVGRASKGIRLRTGERIIDTFKYVCKMNSLSLFVHVLCNILICRDILSLPSVEVFLLTTSALVEKLNAPL